MTKRMCSHLEMWSFDPNWKRPEPTEMLLNCKCGQNAYCPTCGFGWGSHPCDCNRAITVGVSNELSL